MQGHVLSHSIAEGSAVCTVPRAELKASAHFSLRRRGAWSYQ